MKKILLLTIFMVSLCATAQVKLTGVVKDSIGEPLEMANVLAINKVTNKMASYGFTDANGYYKLNVEKNASIILKISYVGMIPAEFNIETKSEDITNNVMLAYDNALEGINIVSKMPVTVKGDTIVYNADSFQNGTERKLEDVIKKLPGVEINDDGEIEVEGNTVEKIMIDGKDFFDGDTKLATKNIPSNALDKIEVLRNYADVSQLSGVQNNQDRVAINIKLKEGKKNFWFGEVTAGGGSAPDEALYLFQPKLFYYSPKYTINVIGDVNNIGEVVLDRSDIRNFSGGFRSQSPSNGTNLSLADAGIGFLTANARNANRIETKLSAINFSYSPTTKLDLSGFLIFSSNSNGQKNSSIIDYVDEATPDENKVSTTDQTSNTGLFKFSANYKQNARKQYNYDLIGRFSNEFRTDEVESNVLNNISEDERSTPYKINQNFSYFYTANEKNIFALEAQHLLQDEDPFYVAALEKDSFVDEAETLGLDPEPTSTNLLYTLEQDRRVKSNQLDVKLDYYNILNDKSNLNFVVGTIQSKQNFDSRFFQILDDGSEHTPTPTIPGNDDPQTINDTEYTFSDIYGGLRYRLKAGIFTITPGFTVHAYNVKNTQYQTEIFEDQFQKVFPEFSLIAQFKQSESLRFSYKQEVNFTDVNQLARGIVANSYDSFYYGNEALMNAQLHNVNLNYSSFNLFNYTNVFARINYRKTMDQINSNVIYEDGSVVSSSTSLNSPFDNESLTASGRVGKTFNKIKTSLGANYSFSKTYQFINSLENTNELFSQSYTASVSTNFTKAPNLSLGYSLRLSDQDNSSRDAIVKGVTNAPSVSFDAYVWNSLTIRSDFSYNEVKQDGVVANSYKILDATFAYRKDKDAKWEYELVGSNLLATGSTASVNTSNLAFSINETFILPRFISLRVRYQL
ncbi:carboxypeptidase-like regulatory domain-containing protein [Polaribacter sargassicola]|uniref:carboxypeptidase-like regulatory domain-containing protein n=1 Tax=Polaribacter sargassicola TaxID=2836891 RepID=UPI001F2F1855|nr:carboxypeptidase-like regulatory domain-containing protein [Polaribacter sp. DS7-9]MCG1036088.1 carboxypeptidase-like regulatory domain-containing protein [Polaribacter sp. DS7-9]